MFRLGPLSCPACGSIDLGLVAGAVANLSDGGAGFTGTVRCPACPALWHLELVLTATDDGPLAGFARGLQHAPTFQEPSDPPGPSCDIGPKDFPADVTPPAPFPAAPYPCEHLGCGKSFPTRVGLVAHRRGHDDRTEVCDCGKTVRVVAMARHLRHQCPGPARPAPSEEVAEPEAPAPAAPPVPDPAPSPREPKEEAPAPAPRADPLPASGPAATPPVPGACGFIELDGTPCGLTKRATEGSRGRWRRARTAAGYVDLCPHHSDAEPGEVDEAIAALTAGP